MAETLTKEELSEQELAARHERLETGQAAEEALEEHHGLDRRMITFFGIMAAMLLAALDQGIGGVVLAGTPCGGIGGLCSPAERAKYTGMVAGTFGIASVVGPVVGGCLTDGQHSGGLLDITTNWRWIFYVNVPVGAAVMVALFVTFPSLRLIGSHPKIH